MGAEFWLKVLDRYGYPTLVLAALVFIGWRVSKWVSPYLGRILDAHVEGMNALKENTARTAKAVETTAATLETLTSLVEQQGVLLRGFGDTVLVANHKTQERIADMIDKIGRAHV